MIVFGKVLHKSVKLSNFHLEKEKNRVGWTKMLREDERWARDSLLDTEHSELKINSSFNFYGRTYAEIKF